MKQRKIVLNAPVSLGFLALCFFALLLSFITGGKSNQILFSVYRSPLSSPFTYIRFFTHVLGHAGISHLVGNAMYILLLGPLLEENYGKKRIICIILISALCTGLINFIFFPSVSLCGASGVVFSFILLTAFVGFNKKSIPITVILVAVLFLGQQIYEGITQHDSISQISHLIGGLVGALGGYFWNTQKA